jgi:hypothetical protein
LQPNSRKKAAPGSVSVFGPIQKYPTNPKIAAKMLMDRGIKVIPFRVHNKTKTPLIKNWSPYNYSAEMIVREIDRAFGIVVPKGLIVIDLDCDDSGKYVGLDAIVDLATDCGVNDVDFLNTLITDTPSGGMHLWYRVPPNVHVRNSASRIATNVDVRVADKGLVLMPPSINSEGAPYMFSGTGNIARLPKWLLQYINEVNRDAAEVGSAIKRLDYDLLVNNKNQAKYLANRAGLISGAGTGARNNTLNAVAYSIYRRVAGGLIDAYAADMAIENAALIAGLDAQEVAATMRSAALAAASAPILVDQRTSHSE